MARDDGAKSVEALLIALARKLLADPETTVKEVAESLGVNRALGEAFGVSEPTIHRVLKHGAAA
jgi:hypothetical protein